MKQFLDRVSLSSKVSVALHVSLKPPPPAHLHAVDVGGVVPRAAPRGGALAAGVRDGAALGPGRADPQAVRPVV